MIMLICRWMCPESLHIYRRMGTVGGGTATAGNATILSILHLQFLKSSSSAGLANCIFQLVRKGGLSLIVNAIDTL